MRRQDEIRLRHMLDAVREAMSFARHRTRQDLDADRMLVLAVVKDIEIIGEAANSISQETRARLRHIPWRDIVGMRNRLIHAYFDVDLDVVWQTVTSDLPALEPLLVDALGTPPNS
jgi:uncharacterized protein with HEPN domain